MNVSDVVGTDALTVRRVYGEPYEKNGVTVIPAAMVLGGGGGGGGESPDGPHGPGSGFGGGYGLIARPVGAYVIRNGEVTWVPSFDVNLVAVIALLIIRSLLRAHRRERRRASS
jgi:uncharacterized spore protein YtfJ